MKKPVLVRPLRSRVLDHAEVGQVDLLGGLRDQDVPGLDVAMDQVALVRGVEAVRGLLEDEQRPPHPQRAFATDQGLEIAALDVAHRDEELAVDLAGVEDRHDVGVVELGCPARLALEAVAVRLVVAEHRGEQLQRDPAAEAHVLGQVDHAHAAAAKQRLHAVTRYLRPDARVVARAHGFLSCRASVGYGARHRSRRGDSTNCDGIVQGPRGIACLRRKRRT